MKTFFKLTTLVLVVIGLVACGRTGDLTPAKSVKTQFSSTFNIR